MSRNKKTSLVAVAAAMLSLAANVKADTLVDHGKVQPYQATNTGYVRTGLTAKGFTDQKYLHVGGGFTITCQGGTAPIPIENSAFFSTGNGVYRNVYVPPSPLQGDGMWLMPGFNQWPYDEVHSCYVNYKVLARGASASGGVTITGHGFGIGFNVTLPPSEVVQTAFTAFDMIRKTPGCKICCP